MVAVNGEAVEARELRYVLRQQTPRRRQHTQGPARRARHRRPRAQRAHAVPGRPSRCRHARAFIILTNDGVLANRSDAPALRRPQDVRGPCTRQGDAARSGHPAAGHRARGRSHQPRPRSISRSRAPRRPSSSSRSTRAASVRCGACSTPSACRSRSLHRRRFGPLSDKGLDQGAYRELTGEEVDALRRAGEQARGRLGRSPTASPCYSRRRARSSLEAPQAGRRRSRG